MEWVWHFRRGLDQQNYCSFVWQVRGESSIVSPCFLRGNLLQGKKWSPWGLCFGKRTVWGVNTECSRALCGMQLRPVKRGMLSPWKLIFTPEGRWNEKVGEWGRESRQAPAVDCNGCFQPASSWSQDQAPTPKDQSGEEQHPPSG